MIYVLLIASLISLKGDLLVLVVPVLSFLLYGWLSTPTKVDLALVRTLSAARPMDDETVEVSVTITNKGSTLNEVLLEDQLPGGLVLKSGSPRRLVALKGGAEFKIQYRIYAKRGVYEFGPLKVSTTDALGLFPRSLLLNAVGKLTVYPKVLPLGYIAIRPRRTRIYPGSIPSRSGGSGLEFYGVRDFQPGDPPRVINWRSTARHTFNHPEIGYPGGNAKIRLKFISNQFQQERVADVGIVLDGRELSNVMAGHSMFEKSVMAAAALADAFLKQGNRVGLLVYGQFLDWTFPAYGKLQKERILFSLAGARLGASSVFAGLDGISTRMFPAGSQIILVSPLAAEDWKILVRMRAHGYQVLVLSPDPLAFEYAWLSGTAEMELALKMARLERRLLIRRLQRAGIQVIEWDVSKPFEQVVRPQLMRYRPAIHPGISI